MTASKRFLLVAVCCLLCGNSVTHAQDWPMWRGDAMRSAATDHALPGKLSLHWTRQLPTPAPAWLREQDYHGKLEFDAADQAVASGGKLFVPSSARDSLTALDLESGEELWRFYANGPIRFAPACWQDNVYTISDDGHLYCLAADTGALRWKFRGGPADRHLLGNQRLIAAWPARGAPVVADGIVYFGAGIWPFMGTFLHAIDAEHGEPVWTNSDSGAIYNLHQHGGAMAFGGVAPQGYIAVAGDKLVVSGGLTVPAIFDRATGEFQHFEQSHAAVGKGSGGFAVAAQGDYYFNHGKAYRLVDGKQLGSIEANVLAGKLVVGINKGAVSAWQFTTAEEEVADRRGKKSSEEKFSVDRQWTVTVPKEIETVELKAGNRLYASGPTGTVVAIDMPGDENEGIVVWQEKIDGTIRGMLAANEHLVVITEEGRLYCFGESRDQPVVNHGREEAPLDQPADAQALATRLLAAADNPTGYALVLGLKDGALSEAILSQSELQLIAVDDDAERIERLRRRWDEAGWYGERISILQADLATASLPPYVAEFIFSEDADALEDRIQNNWHHYYESLRPYGGTAVFPVSGERQSSIAKAGLEGAKLTQNDDLLAVSREGSLPDTGSWTHQYGNSSNTVFSAEQRVKLPLGVLWFGGPSNQNALPRHGQGPIPHVVGGRLIIEGVNTISARCVYTGRELWVREFDDIGFPYKSANHSFTGALYIQNQPGANYIGSNYVSTKNGVYVVYRDECHRLDNATGETLNTFRLPSFDEKNPQQHAAWGYIGIEGDYLIAGAEPQIFDDQRIGQKNWNRTSSKRVVVMNRYSGEVLWTTSAEHGFRHNAIVTGGDRLYLVDRLSDGALDQLKRRGRAPQDPPRLQAFDLASGQRLWETHEDVFATWLSYSETHDVLVQAGRTGGREVLPDEPKEQIIAHDAATGDIVWDRGDRYTGPLIMAGDWIISSDGSRGAFSVTTGEQKQRLHPLTDAQLPWTHSRSYGCGVALGCENLLTFRSGAAGFFDLNGASGAGNFGGFRAGCTPNLIPADGVLNAPDYTRTCSCSYQNQTSLALVSMPDVEIWTWSDLPKPTAKDLIRRVGINLGAPGNRLSDEGVYWINYPSVGGPSPDLSVKVAPKDISWFRKHSSQVAFADSQSGDQETNSDPAWVAASGVEGARKIEISMNQTPPDGSSTYRVRLFFMEPDHETSEDRIFSVALQGKPIRKDLNIASETGGSHRAMKIEAGDVEIRGKLTIELQPSGPSALPPVLCGVEIMLEEDAA